MLIRHKKMSLPALQADINVPTSKLSSNGSPLWPIGLQLVHTSGVSDGTGDGEWSYDVGATHRIMYHSASDKWIDTSDAVPTKVSDSANVNTTAVSGSSTGVNPAEVFLWHNNGGQFLGKFANPFYSAPTWATSSTTTPVTGTQSHSYVQDSIRDITYTKTAPYQFELEFKFRDVSSAPYNTAMGQNAVTMTAKHWPGGGSTSTDIVQYTFQQDDRTNKMTITSPTTFPNSLIDTGDVVTLTADIDMQIAGPNQTWGWISAGSTLFSATYEATNVVATVGSGFVGDTVLVEFVDQNQYPDYDNDVLLQYNYPTGNPANLTSVVLGSTTTLSTTNNHTLSGSWTVGYDGVSNSGLADSLLLYRRTPMPSQNYFLVGQHAFALSPYGQSSNNSRRRGHSFW